MEKLDSRYLEWLSIKGNERTGDEQEQGDAQRSEAGFLRLNQNLDVQKYVTA